MGLLEKRLAFLCSSGVPHLAIGDVAEYADSRVDASHLDSTNFVGVDNLAPNKKGRVDATYLPNTARLTAFRPGDVLLGNIRPYLKKVWLADRAGGCSGDVLAIRRLPAWRAKLIPEFLYYVLSSDAFFAYNTQHAKGGKMPRGSKEAVMSFRVPVPPLAAQREIVGILDTFTELEAELETELEARRRQYEHYQRDLLAFPEGVPRSTLGAICEEVSSGGTPLSTRADFYGGDIPWLRTAEVNYSDIHNTAIHITAAGLEGSAARWVRPNSVIVAISGAGVTRGRVAVNKIPLTTNQHCCNLQIDPTKANYRFVRAWLAHRYEDLRSFGQGNRSDLNVGIIKGYPIALPPLAEQARIADVLDTFDALVNDDSIGLPAELAARGKQYEHYRDRLLTFEELGA